VSPLGGLLSRDGSTGAPEAPATDGASSDFFLDPRRSAVKVNLLPPEIIEDERFRRGQIVRGGAVLSALVLIGAGLVLAGNSVTAAQQEVDAAAEVTRTLNAEVAALSEVPRTESAVATAEAQLTGAMGDEVRWSIYLNDLGIIVPPSVALTNVAVGQTSEDAASAGGTDLTSISVTGTQGIGGATISGQARNYTAIALLLDRLATVDGFVEPYLSSAAVEEDPVSAREVITFTISSTAVEDLRSGRFAEGVE
jgi:Tfp pilus assembly protein PilN